MSTAVVMKLKRHFSVHRTPHTLISENTSQYMSLRFRDFDKHCDFIHITSSPVFPLSNGLAERTVRSAKQLMEKSHRAGTDVFLKLLNLRNILRDPTLGSPRNTCCHNRHCQPLLLILDCWRQYPNMPSKSLHRYLIRG